MASMGLGDVGLWWVGGLGVKNRQAQGIGGGGSEDRRGSGFDWGVVVLQEQEEDGAQVRGRGASPAGRGWAGPPFNSGPCLETPNLANTLTNPPAQSSSSR